MKITEIMDKYINTYSKTVLSEGTVRDYVYRAKFLESAFDKLFGTVSHEVLTLDNMREFQRKRKAERTANQLAKDVAIIKILVKTAFRMKLCDDFTSDLYKIKYEESVKANKIINPQDLEEFLAMAEKNLKPVEYLAVYLGHATMTRPRELLAIRVEDIDFKSRSVVIRGTKTGASSSEMPLSEDSLALIRKFMVDNNVTTGLLFGGKGYWWLYRVYKRMSDWFGMCDAGITPHKARKNMVMKMLDSGVNIKVIQKFGRWKSNTVMLKHYASATEKQLRDAGDVL